MLGQVHIGPWDYALIVAVTLHATLLAYLYDPRWKAFLLALPIPFTLASLAVGRHIDATNVAGLVVLLSYTHGVRWLHYHRRVPIVASIAISAVCYCVAGTILAQLIPPSDLAFWIACPVTMAIGLFFLNKFQRGDEPGHRTPLPLWLKLPAILCVISALVLIKGLLHGFVTMFPMVGVIAGYESRHSLRTVCRQIAVTLVSMVPMLIAIHLAQPALGLGMALAIGWVVYLPMLYFTLEATGMSPFISDERRVEGDEVGDAV